LGVGDECILRRADGSVFGRALTDERRQPYRIEYFDENGRLAQSVDIDYADEASDGSSGSTAPNRCDFTNYLAANIRWDFSPINWYLNYGSLPTYLNRDLSLTNIRNAHAEWENNTNYCGIGDGSTLDFNYSGTTTRTGGNDTFSIVDYGEITALGCSSSGIACSHTWYAVGSGNAIENDIRLDDDVTWTNDPSSFPSRYDIWNVMAHEVGHRALFGHVSDVTQVMYQGHSTGSSIKRKLSRGDATGNNAKY
jgi:hypothetical protein